MSMKHTQQQIPGLMKLSSLLLGGGSLLYFIIFLIAGTRVSIPLGLSPVRALFFDAGLCLIFFVQHSIMVRPWFKNCVFSRVPDNRIPALFSIISGFTLSLVILFWQESGTAFFTFPLWCLTAMGLVFISALLGLKWGVASLPGFDPMGVRTHRSRPEKPVLKFQGPYRYSRHPLYFFVLVLIWASTEPTPDRIVFNLLWSIWIVIGTWFEEKDLVKLFGSDYSEYKTHTPMILPAMDTLARLVKKMFVR